jgi:hypothetical protein
VGRTLAARPPRPALHAQVAPAIVKATEAYLGVSVREYRELEAGTRWPSFDTWQRICKLYGWPQTFATNAGRAFERRPSRQAEGPTTR